MASTVTRREIGIGTRSPVCRTETVLALHTHIPYRTEPLIGRMASVPTRSRNENQSPGAEA